MYSKKYTEKKSSKHKFHHLAKILSNDEYFDMLMKMAVNKG